MGKRAACLIVKGGWKNRREFAFPDPRLMILLPRSCSLFLVENRVFPLGFSGFPGWGSFPIEMFSEVVECSVTVLPFSGKVFHVH
jgi:hypothetical protein